MKWFVCIALLAIGLNGCVAVQNKEFRERAEIYSRNVQIQLTCSLLFLFYIT